MMKIRLDLFVHRYLKFQIICFDTNTDLLLFYIRQGQSQDVHVRGLDSNQLLPLILPDRERRRCLFKE